MKIILLSLMTLFFPFTNHIIAQDCQPNKKARHQIRNSQSPNTYVGRVVVKRKNSYTSTFSFVSPNVIVGAGHSFAETDESDDIMSITLYVGLHYEGRELVSVKEITFQRKNLKILTNHIYIRESDADYDYAFIALPKNVMSEYFEPTSFVEVKSAIDSIFITGYPCDKGCYGQWIKGDVTANVDTEGNVLEYGIYTNKGDSGAPIWAFHNGKPVLLGIHATGNYEGRCNAGIWFTPERLNELNKFIVANKK